DLAQPRHDEGRGSIDGELEGDDGSAQDLEPLGERLGIEGEGAGVVLALIARRVTLAAVAAPLTRREPQRCGRSPRESRLRTARLTEPARVERVTSRGDPRRRPRGLRHPPPRAHAVRRARRHTLLHPHPIRRLVHDPGVDALEPVIPPSPRLLEEADRRSGYAVVRVVVAPRSDETLPRRAQPREETGNRVRVGVRPPADRVDGARDPLEILAHRAVLPVGVTALMPEPHLGEEHTARE